MLRWRTGSVQRVARRPLQRASASPCGVPRILRSAHLLRSLEPRSRNSGAPSDAAAARWEIPPRTLAHCPDDDLLHRVIRDQCGRFAVDLATMAVPMNTTITARSQTHIFVSNPRMDRWADTQTEVPVSSASEHHPTLMIGAKRIDTAINAAAHVQTTPARFRGRPVLIVQHNHVRIGHAIGDRHPSELE